MRHLKDAFLERKAALADRIGVAERDFITLGIATAAIIMFVGTGGTVVPKIMASLSGVGIGPDSALVNALLLNIALIIFGWRRYRQLSDEVAERRRAEENARKLAETDPLTALLNRRGFANALGRLVESARETGSPVAVMMIDLDNFKRINDLNGHSAGDHVLMECTRRIGDLMPRSAVLARIGGDEFAVALRFDQQRPESVEKFAADILEALARPIAVTDARVEVTASVGITRADLTDGPDGPDFMRDPARLLEMADIAMYHAKRQGRNGYFWFEQRMADEMRYRVELENGIRDGLDKGEFVPFYEQQIDLETGELTGFEMLARWNSPRFGIVKPDIFIPLAEEIGLIGDLSEQLVAQALEDARQWDPGLTLSVNISPVQLRDPWFSQRLIKLLLSANFPPQRLEIEITESCIHENLGLVKTLISSLRNQGIQISLDDFGTGYSSLAQLRNLSFDRIKIDKSFVMTMGEDKENLAIVQAIALIGKGLDLPVTAEGIESDAILEKLREIGKIKGQGYLYGHPRPAAEVHAWLAEQGLLQPRNDASSDALAPAQPAPEARRASNG